MRSVLMICAAVIGLAASTAEGHAAGRAPIPEGAAYVALGSSYAAGPGVTERAEGGPPQCSQSRDNYARQLARMRKLTLVDRSCGGATTVDVLRGGQFGLPPQLDALTPDTRLVSVTIGGNDVRFTADLGASACRHRAEAHLAEPGGPPCAPAPAFDLEQAFIGLEANLREIVAAVRRRSPKARLVFVDYVTVLPAGPACAALALTQADAEALRTRAERLAQLTARIATEAGIDMVKASDLSRGHDACAAEPWVRGFAQRKNPADWTPVAFHPLLPAMTAIARSLDRTLRN